MIRFAPVVLVSAALLGACSSDPPPSPPAVPSLVLPANMDPLKCADFEPPPVVKPTVKYSGRRCSDPDGKTHWITGAYSCADGRIWPMLADQQDARLEQPSGTAWDACYGMAWPTTTTGAPQ